MDSGLYNKALKCPVCSKEFEVTKVKIKASKVASRDSDFCIYYEGINPMLYDAWVCEHCGYAALYDKFEELNIRDTKLIRDNISNRWNRRSFSGERTVDNAIDAFKIVLLNLQVRKAKNADLAKALIRIAWMYRLKKDGKEKDFLQFALKCYTETYEKEDLSTDKLDENTCMYMIAELNRRVGNFTESIKWFSRIISSPSARSNPSLLELARDQYQLARDEMGKVAVSTK